MVKPLMLHLLAPDLRKATSLPSTSDRAAIGLCYCCVCIPMRMYSMSLHCVCYIFVFDANVYVKP